MRRHFKPLIAADKPMRKRQQHDEAEDGGGVVHGGGGDGQDGGEGEEDDHEDAEGETGDVDGDAPDAQPEGAVGRVAALEFADQDEGEGHHVGEVETHGGEGEDGGKGGGVADVDQADQGGDRGDEAEGVEGDAQLWVDLSEVRKRQRRGENLLVRGGGMIGLRLTCAKKPEKGRPLSRANAQVRRETEAKTPKSAIIVEKRIMHMMMVAPALELVAWKRIWMTGNPVGVLRAASTSPIQKRRVIKKPSAMTVLSTTAHIMALGTFLGASEISSLRWRTPSKPV